MGSSVTVSLDAADTHGNDLSSLRDYMLGAAQVPPHVVARANALGIATYRGYGSSEHPTISSDIIVRGGENISSKEVEDILGTHPDVLAAAAIGVPDARYGERVGVFVTLRPGATLTIADADAHFRAAGVARQKTPEVIRIVDDLPRTAAGKVQKFALRALLKESQDEF